MTRSEAFELLTNHVASEKMHFHCLASAAVMEALAIKLNQNADDWYLAGLLHDLDVEITRDTPSTHGLITVDLLKDKGLNEDILHAIEAHNEIASRFPRTSLFDHALAAGETISGLISATALVYPDKRIASVKSSSVIKRMKEKNFAASEQIENIMEIELCGITLPEFAELALVVMKRMEQPD